MSPNHSQIPPRFGMSHSTFWTTLVNSTYLLRSQAPLVWSNCEVSLMCETQTNNILVPKNYGHMALNHNETVRNLDNEGETTGIMCTVGTG